MKRIILLLISVACYFSSYAQSIKFGNPGNVRVLSQFSEQYYSSPEYGYERPKIYQVISDWTIIKGIEYCMVRSTLYPGGTKFDYFREEEGKVY